MVAKIKAAIVAFIARPDVQSVARHAATAAIAVVVAAVSVGLPVTTAVAIAALGAAARVVWVAVSAHFSAGA